MKRLYKLFMVLLMVCFSFTIVACKEPQQQEEPKPVVDTVEVTGYEESVYFSDSFDESNIEVEVTFKDGTSKKYGTSDLEFDYTYFDSSSLGEQTVTVKVVPLDVTEDITVEVVRKVVKVLMISNSFGDDTIQWVHEIAYELGYDFTITNLYIGGCTLDTHLANLQQNKGAYEYRTYSKKTNQWSSKSGVSIKKALESEDWDYVSLQQGSWASGKEEEFVPLGRLMDGILEIKSDTKFIWNMTWAYQKDSNHASFYLYNYNQMEMYNAIVNCVKTKVLTDDRFLMVVPNGTAVQNARTSFLGDTLCRDQYCHLTYDLGRYIAGLTMVATVTGVDITNIKYAPTGVEALGKAAAIESVKNALLNPYSVTNSKY